MAPVGRFVVKIHLLQLCRGPGHGAVDPRNGARAADSRVLFRHRGRETLPDYLLQALSAQRERPHRHIRRMVN